MNKKNRYCCLLMPCNIIEECKYFEIELQIKDLKRIVTDINKEMNVNFDSTTAIINDKYGILIYDNTVIENQYISKLGKIKRYGKCLLITHNANLNDFLKISDLQLYDDNIKNITHNSSLCRKMILLCIFHISSKNELDSEFYK